MGKAGHLLIILMILGVEEHLHFTGSVMTLGEQIIDITKNGISDNFCGGHSFSLPDSGFAVLGN